MADFNNTTAGVRVEGEWRDDQIINTGDNVTIRGAGGDDSIENSGNHVVFEFEPNFDGFDTIQGFNETSTLKINSTENYSRVIVGNDVVLKFAGASVTLLNAASLSNVNIQGGTEISNPVTPTQQITGTSGDDKNLYNTLGSNVFIDGLAGNDDISNGANEVTISGGDGNDYIHTSAMFGSLSGGAGNDTLHDIAGRNTLDGGDGDDVIDVMGDKATILGGDGKDSIQVSGYKAFVQAGEGDDTVDVSSEKSVVIADAGDDVINVIADDVTVGGNHGNDVIKIGGAGFLNQPKNTFVEYTDGDGNDVIEGFSETSTLQIGGANYTSTKSGDDIIFNVGTGSITLKDAANLTNLNIDGIEDSGTPAGSSNIIWGTEKKDDLSNDADNMIICALEDDDTITNAGNNVEIDTGDGNNRVINRGEEVTVKGGADDDLVENYKGKASIDTGDGDDAVTNYYGGKNSVIKTGDGIDQVANFANNTTIETGAGNDIVENRGANSIVDLGDGDNSIDNRGDKSSIVAGNAATAVGNKINNYAKEVTVKSGAGVDVVNNFGKQALIDTGAGDDIVNNFEDGENSSIETGAGDDEISNYADNTTIKAGAGDDNIYNCDAKNLVIEYTDGDGNDTVWDFNKTSTLKIGDGTGTYSTIQSGNDIIVNVGTGSITLKDAANLSNLNIDGIDNSPAPAGSSNIIWGTPKKDDLSNDRDDMIIYALEDDDTVTNSGDRNEIYGEDGDDEINNYGDNSTIYGGHGKDSVYNTGENAFILDDAGDDYFHNMGDGTTISGGDGDDVIDNLDGDDVYLSGGQGNDSIRNVGARATLYGIYGNNTLENYYSEEVSMVGGDGNDLIKNYGGEKVTIEGGTGDDSIGNSGDNVTVNAGFGDDSIHNIGEYATINAGAGNDIVDNFASNATIDGERGDDIINNMVADTNARTTNVKIFGGEGNDVINNNGNSVTIEGGDGSDTLRNFGGQNVVMDAEGGNNFINNNALGKTVTITSGSGKDTVENYSDEVSIKTGAGNDSIVNTGKDVTIDAGADNDYIYNMASENVTITTGAGSDTVELNQDVTGVTVTDFGKGDEIWLPNQASSITDNGTSIVVNYTNGNVVTINGVNQLASVDYSWRIENGVAIYTKKTSAGVVLSSTGMKIVCSDNVQTEDIFRISGLKSGLTVNADGSIDGLKVDGNQITVSRNVLSTKPVSVNNGYELVLGDDVPVPTLKEESRKVITFGSSSNFMYTSPYTTAGWQIDNGKIIYAPVNGFETFKITGLMKGFDIEKISVNGYTITLPYEVLNGATNVKLSTNFSYTLALGDDCPTVTDNANYWKVNGTNATYYANGKTDGFAVSQNGKDITYTAAVDGNRKISVSGLLENLTSEDLDENISVNGKVINVNPNVVGKNFSVTNGYKIIFDAGNYASNNFVSTLTTDTIENFGDNLKIDVGEGNDKIYTEGNAVTVEGGLGSDSVDNHGDNVKIYGGKDNDTIRTDGDYVTVKGGDGNDYIDNHGDNVLIEGDDKITVLSNGISSSSLVVGKGDDMILTDGENVTINGGKGDDRIISSATSGNVYQYANDDGKDIIWGYSRNDTIQLTDVSSITAVNFNVPAGTKDIVITIGSGSITLKDAAKKSTALTFVDTDGKEISSWRYLPIFAGGVFVNNNTGYIVNAATGAVFSTNTGGDFGNSDGDISNADSTADSDVVIQHLDASLVKVAVKLIGDTDDNSLIGGSGNDTLIGGGGEDTFVGGKGSDLFIHDGGDVTIADYGDGSDKISLGSAFDGFNINGTDLVLNSATGSVTLKDAVGKKITLVENGKSTTEIFASDGKTNSAGTAITLASSTQSFAAADSKLVTIDGSLTSNSTITGNAKSNKIFGGDGDDMLIGMSGNDTLFGGAGSDIFIHDSGKDIILDFNGNEDKIVIGTGKISSSSVNSKGDVVFKIGTDSVTVKKIDGEDISDGKKITITDDDGETSYTYFSEKIVSADGKVTLQSNFKGSSFTAEENISEIDASKVTKKFAITGNDKANTIVGGKGANLIDGGNGNDLLFGGKGNDTFVISEGNDTIADYLSGSNKISLGSAQIKNYSVDDGDVIFSFEGGNSLTIQDAAGEKITLVENGKSVVNVYAADGIFNTAKTAVTLAADSQIFSTANYSKLTTINGSAVTDEVEIIGNGNANKIYAGDFDSTLNGGGGNDTLWGGNGSDTFIYDSGNGKDVIYDFGAEDMLQIGAEFTASLKNNSVAFKVGTTAGAITLKNFSGTEFVANGDTYQLSGSTFTKK